MRFLAIEIVGYESYSNYEEHYSDRDQLNTSFHQRLQFYFIVLCLQVDYWGYNRLSSPCLSENFIDIELLRLFLLHASNICVLFAFGIIVLLLCLLIRL